MLPLSSRLFNASLTASFDSLLLIVLELNRLCEEKMAKDVRNAMLYIMQRIIVREPS